VEANHPLAALLLSACLLLAAGARAHPFHASHGELEWSRDGRSLDVALKLIPEDLEEVLAQHGGKTFRLSDNEETHHLVERYLQQHFELLDGQSVAPLRLLGMQLEPREVWLYFSCLRAPVPGLRLRHTVLMDLIPRQHNHLRALWTPGAASLLFTAGEPEQELPVYADN
jgi:hypothetical protein